MNIKEVSLTKENIIKIKKIDDTFYINDHLNIDWYLERYNENHKALFLYDNSKVVGYILSVPIKKELYDAITKGVIINDININPNMIINESKYNYIVSIVLLKEYRNKGYGTQLIKEVIKRINKQGKKYCALTISKEGYAIAKKNLKFKMSVYKNTNVFTEVTDKQNNNIRSDY